MDWDGGRGDSQEETISGQRAQLGPDAALPLCSKVMQATTLNGRLDRDDACMC